MRLAVTGASPCNLRIRPPGNCDALAKANLTKSPVQLIEVGDVSYPASTKRTLLHTSELRMSQRCARRHRSSDAVLCFPSQRVIDASKCAGE